MQNVDPANLERDYPLSHALLAHGDLMTPRLVRLFGPVHAQQTAVEDDGQRLTRWSTIFQTASGAPLLDARLVLSKSALPDSIIGQLMTTDRLFGALLIERGIAIGMTERRIFRIAAQDGGADDRFGRSQRMLQAESGTLICDVEEALRGESHLARLAR